MTRNEFSASPLRERPRRFPAGSRSTGSTGVPTGLVLLLVASLSASAGFAQFGERLDAGTFDDAGSLSNWTDTSLTGSVWSGDDWNGSPTSGSLYTTYSGGASTSGEVVQCVAVGSDSPYVASARALIESGQSESGYFNLYVQFFDGVDCTVLIVANAGTSFLPGPYDSWQMVEFGGTTPATAQSALVNVRVFKEASGTPGEPFSVFIDEVSLVVTDADIFADGFESGDLTAWGSP